MTLDDVFDDAHRRVCIAKTRNEIDRSRMWVGLAFPSEMKAAVSRGLLRPLHGSGKARVLNWYVFTDAGWSEYDRRYLGKPDWFAIRENVCCA